MTATASIYVATDSTDVTNRGSVVPDTSAALELDEEVLSTFPVREPPGKSRRCMWFVVPVLIVVVAAAVAGLVVGTRGSSGKNSNSASADPAKDSGTLLGIPDGSARNFNLSVVNAIPHDSAAFIEGFAYNPSRDVFFESTGLTGGKSSLRRVNVTSGEVLKLVKLPSPDLFGEGITLYGSKDIFMLTWRSNRGFVFDQDTLELRREWNYTGEGWGLTIDPATELVYMSNGSNLIRVLDPKTLTEKRVISVTLDGKPQKMLNELEWICGELWANVWMETKIVRIDPSSGQIRSVILADNLPRPEDITGPIDVLNGIAFDKASFRVWLTGKLWPKIYEVTISDPALKAQCGK